MQKIFLGVEIPNEITDKRDKIEVALEEINAGRFTTSLTCGRFVAAMWSDGAGIAIIGIYETYEDALEAFRDMMVEDAEDRLAQAEEHETRFKTAMRETIDNASTYSLDDICDCLSNLCARYCH